MILVGIEVNSVKFAEYWKRNLEKIPYSKLGNAKNCRNSFVYM